MAITTDIEAKNKAAIESAARENVEQAIKERAALDAM